jgi:hypothetical protein
LALCATGDNSLRRNALRPAAARGLMRERRIVRYIMVPGMAVIAVLYLGWACWALVQAVVG